MNKKKVVLGMSGGVDSSTSAYMLQKEGYEVIGVTLVCSEGQLNSKDLLDAKELAKKLGIKHIELNVIEEFKEKIIGYFLNEYSNGMTPSPCIVCDENIKMKKLIEIADKEGAYYISTGHYCKIKYNNEFQKGLLIQAEDLRKDQSYMLYRIKPEILDRMLFPLANLKKTEVREKAKSFEIEVHDKKDSQGICFAKEGYIDFLKANLKEKIKSGNFVDADGKILGQHQGYQLYTIGQRRGLGVLFNKIYFIIDIVPERNEIILGEYSELDKEKIELSEFISHISIEKLKKLEVIGRARFSSEGFKGKIIIENNKVFFKFKEKNPHNAKGQHLVLYKDGYVLGGGKIIF